jgi:bifunctional non-homologous end joining protein LigD
MSIPAPAAAGSGRGAAVVALALAPRTPARTRSARDFSPAAAPDIDGLAREAVAGQGDGADMAPVPMANGLPNRMGAVDLHGGMRRTLPRPTWMRRGFRCMGPCSGARKDHAVAMARTSTLPEHLRPMLATLTDAPFDDPDWVFESKWDGFRMVASIEGGSVTLYSRNGKLLSDSYRPVAQALQRIGRDAVVDGELVALDAHGVSRFQLLQNALRNEARLRYCLFDLMFLQGKDLRRLPLVDRKARLQTLLPKDDLLSFSAHRPEHGRRCFAEAQRQGLEGLMAKRAASSYRSGARSTDWLKIKTARRQEVAIVGFTAPRGTRPHFGALVLAVREGNAWRYVGHVGTGFSHAALERIYGLMRPLRTAASPFRVRVKDEAATTWVEPKLVAEVKFTEWTAAGEMRHPVFLGLRTDKRPEDVVREQEKRRPGR